MFTLIITGFIGLAYEGISSISHNIRHKVLHKAVKAMETKTNIQCNKLMHLEDTMVMYGIYNAETLEKLIKTVHGLHKTKTMQEQLFAGELTAAHSWYIHTHGIRTTQQYAVNSIIYLRTIKEKYILLYKEFRTQL